MAGDFHRVPFIVIWETTRACGLACAHCRAQAQPDPLPGELSTEEGFALVDEAARMGTRILVLSGGDPLRRADLTDLIRKAKSRGLRVGTIPAATPLLTREIVRALKEAGLDQMALSMDFSTARDHDRFRGVEGTFQKVMAAAEWAHQLDLPLQINTVVSSRNFDDLDSIMGLVQRLGIVFWEVFFLIPVGRGTGVEGLTPDQCEEVFGKLYGLASRAVFTVKVTEAPHYRRYCIQRGAVLRGRPAAPGLGSRPGEAIGPGPQGINAGKGHLFVSSTGEVYPSGFLPLSAGNVRQTPLTNLYRTSPIFRELRQPGLLKGRCGACAYREICGGSRSRAFAVTGDYLAEEPWCAYAPAGREERR